MKSMSSTWENLINTTGTERVNRYTLMNHINYFVYQEEPISVDKFDYDFSMQQVFFNV